MPSTDCLAWQAIDDACMDIIDLLQKAPNSDSVLQGSEPSLATRSNVPDLHLEEKARRMIENMNIAKGSWSGRQAYLSVLQAHLERLATDVQSNFKKQWIERLSYSQISSMTQEAVITIHIKRFEEEMNHCRQLLEGSFLNESPMEDSATIGHEWTTEARSLMEHVYQKLPRLEQHEKKTLAEVSGLSLRQITIWFANQRQRRGWPPPLEEHEEEEMANDNEDDNHDQSSPCLSSSTCSSLSLSSSTSSLEPLNHQDHQSSSSPVSPGNGPCPSLSSSTSSRSSSGSWTASPTTGSFAYYDTGVLNTVGAGQSNVFAPSYPPPSTAPTSAHPAGFDVDQLLRQLEGGNQAPPNTSGSFSTGSSNESKLDMQAYFCRMPEQAMVKTESPFNFIKSEQTEMILGTNMLDNAAGIPSPLGAWKPTHVSPSQLSIDHNSCQWLPMNNMLPQSGTGLSLTLTEPTPHACQQNFAPLQLDISQYRHPSSAPTTHTFPVPAFSGMQAISPSDATRSGTSSPFWSEMADGNTWVPPSQALQAASFDNGTQLATQTETSIGIASYVDNVPCQPSIFSQSTDDWQQEFLNDLEFWSKSPEQSCESHMQ